MADLDVDLDQCSRTSLVAVVETQRDHLQILTAEVAVVEASRDQFAASNQ